MNLGLAVTSARENLRWACRGALVAATAALLALPGVARGDPPAGALLPDLVQEAPSVVQV
jgi:hypothetical protein